MRALLVVVLLVVSAVHLPHARAEAADTSSAPRVRIVTPAPLVLSGTGFRTLEKVRLTVELGKTKVVRRVRASRDGTFGARFLGIRYDRCHGALAVRAFGARGSVVAWKVVPLPCPLEPGGS